MRFKRFILACAVCLCFCLGGCRYGGEQEDRESFIYVLNAEKTGLAKQDYEYLGEDALEIAENMLEEMNKPTDDIDYISPIPEEVRVLNCVLRGSILDIDFSGEYDNQGRLDEKLMRAAVVQSLVRIEGINAVSFTVEGKTLQDSEGIPVGLMNGDDFVENTGASPSSYLTGELSLYFSDKSGEHLIRQIQKVRYSSNVSKEKLIVEKLMQGPSDSEAFPVINPDTNLLSVTIKDRICYVNFDSTFLTGEYDVLPEVTIYSIVNSLVDGTDAELVQITINGESNAKYMDKIDLSQPLKENRELIAVEEDE